MAAAAVAVYINANPGVQMESWLDVVLPSDSGAFKMPTWIPLACYLQQQQVKVVVGKL
jgi:PiT family inorganic phosphate transporter